METYFEEIGFKEQFMSMKDKHMKEK